MADDGDLRKVQHALHKAGVSADDFGVFGSGSKVAGIPASSFDYRAATPVLIRVLPELNDPKVREAVVRSLSTSVAKPSAVPVLLAEFSRTSADSEAALKWAVGNALETTAVQASVDALLPLALDPTHGQGRQMIVARLGRAAKDPRIVEALLGLIDDPDVALHAMSALRNQLGREAARPHIEALLRNDDPKVRAVAARQLKKIRS